MSDSPLLSIITAVRNGAPYLRDLIESVLQQSHTNFEHIIIDDGSDDDGATVAILRQYPHLRWWSRENKGQYASQNDAIAAARGMIVAIISADDVYVTPNIFSQVAEYWTSHPNCQWLYGKTWHMDREGERLPYQLDIAGRYPRWLLKYYLYIPHSSLFVLRKFIIDNELWFDPSYKYAGDWEWIIRLSIAAQEIGYLPEYLSTLRMHPNQTTRTGQLEAIVAEHQKICRIYGVDYRVHLLLRKLVQYRAMSLIASATLRTGGISGLWALSKDWLNRRRLKNLRSGGMQVHATSVQITKNGRE